MSSPFLSPLATSDYLTPAGILTWLSLLCAPFGRDGRVLSLSFFLPLPLLLLFPIPFFLPYPILLPLSRPLSLSQLRHRITELRSVEYENPANHDHFFPNPAGKM